MSLVSIVTITQNNEKLLTNYFKKLYLNTPAKDFELILIENSLNEKAYSFAENLAKEYKYYYQANIRLFKNNTMKSFAANCNFGAKEATNNLVMFLNDDTEVQENWLSPLIETLNRDDGHYPADRIAAVGSKMFFPDGFIQHCGIAFHEKDRMPGHMWWHKRKRDDPKVNHPRRVTAITGGAMLVKKRIFFEFGGFDEVYLAGGYEDIDLCLKLKENNYIVKYEPRSEIMHYESATQKKINQQYRQECFVKNTQTFLSRWYHKIDPDFGKMTYGEEE